MECNIEHETIVKSEHLYKILTKLKEDKNIDFNAVILLLVKYNKYYHFQMIISLKNYYNIILELAEIGNIRFIYHLLEIYKSFKTNLSTINDIVKIAIKNNNYELYNYITTKRFSPDQKLFEYTVSNKRHEIVKNMTGKYGFNTSNIEVDYKRYIEGYQYEDNILVTLYKENRQNEIGNETQDQLNHALTVSIQSGFVDFAMYLLHRGANPNVNYVFLRALERYYTTICIKMIEIGLDDPRQYINMIVMKDNLMCFQKILSVVELTDEELSSICSIAAYHKAFYIIHYLKTLNIDIRNAIVCAAEHRDIELLRVLFNGHHIRIYEFINSIRTDDTDILNFFFSKVPDYDWLYNELSQQIDDPELLEETYTYYSHIILMKAVKINNEYMISHIIDKIPKEVIRKYKTDSIKNNIHDKTLLFQFLDYIGTDLALTIVDIDKDVLDWFILNNKNLKNLYDKLILHEYYDIFYELIQKIDEEDHDETEYISFMLDSSFDILLSKYEKGNIFEDILRIVFKIRDIHISTNNIYNVISNFDKVLFCNEFQKITTFPNILRQALKSPNKSVIKLIIDMYNKEQNYEEFINFSNLLYICEIVPELIHDVLKNITIPASIFIGLVSKHNNLFDNLIRYTDKDEELLSAVSNLGDNFYLKLIVLNQFEYDDYIRYMQKEHKYILSLDYILSNNNIDINKYIDQFTDKEYIPILIKHGLVITDEFVKLMIKDKKDDVLEIFFIHDMEKYLYDAIDNELYKFAAKIINTTAILDEDLIDLIFSKKIIPLIKVLVKRSIYPSEEILYEVCSDNELLEIVAEKNTTLISEEIFMCMVKSNNIYGITYALKSRIYPTDFLQRTYVLTDSLDIKDTIILLGNINVDMVKYIEVVGRNQQYRTTIIEKLKERIFNADEVFISLLDGNLPEVISFVVDNYRLQNDTVQYAIDQIPIKYQYMIEYKSIVEKLFSYQLRPSVNVIMDILYATDPDIIRMYLQASKYDDIKNILYKFIEKSVYGEIQLTNYKSLLYSIVAYGVLSILVKTFEPMIELTEYDYEQLIDKAYNASITNFVYLIPKINPNYRSEEFATYVVNENLPDTLKQMFINGMDASTFGDKLYDLASIKRDNKKLLIVLRTNGYGPSVYDTVDENLVPEDFMCIICQDDNIENVIKLYCQGRHLLHKECFRYWGGLCPLCAGI